MGLNGLLMLHKTDVAEIKAETQVQSLLLSDASYVRQRF